jgi:hypothetical protein
MGGRHHPVGIRGHVDVQHVAHEHDVHVLPFDRQGRLGNQRLKDTFVLPISREEGFIGKKHDAIAQVIVEIAHEVL